MNGKKLSRRDFLKGATVAGASVAALGLASCDTQGDPVPPEQKPDEITWDKEIDIFITGSGACAMVAACVLADAGKSVLIVDKNPKFGGCSVLAGGNISWGGPIQSQSGAWSDFTADAAYDRLRDISVRENKKNDPALVRKFVDNTSATHQFLLDHGVKLLDASGATPLTYIYEYEADPGPGNPLVNSDGSFCGSGLVRPLADAAREKGVEILEEHEVIRLVREESGKVVGGVAVNNGKELYFKGNDAVLIASGGWKGHKVLRKLFDPRIPEDMGHTGEPYAINDGKVIDAAMAIGAAICSDNSNDTALFRNKFGTPLYNYRPGEDIAAPGITVSASQSDVFIYVNSKGERYVDETRTISNASLFDPTFLADDYTVWLILDEEGRAKYNYDVTAPRCDPDYAYSADTIEDLATKTGLPASALAATVNKYNGYVDAGADPDFNKPAEKLTSKILAAPFHAVRVMFYVHDTAGGLWITGDGQVKDFSGNIISGLYAGGDAAGGLGVIGLPRACTQGYIAANHILKS